MKNKTKRFLLAILAVLCSLVFAGCSGSTTDTTVDETTASQLEAQAQNFVETLMGYDDATIDRMVEEFNLDQQAVLSAGLTSWKTSKDDLGAYISTDSASVEKESDGGYTTTLRMTFEKRQCTFVLGVDRKMQNATEVTFSPDYTLGEKMTDAFGNLIVGMGTVFAVLTLIMFVIMAFRFIPQDLGEPKEAAKPKQAAAAPAPAPAPAKRAAAAPAPVCGAELEAVIAAAIAAYEEDQGIPHGAALQNGIVVRSVRRVSAAGVRR